MNRFERKILAAIVIVAVMPLVGALVLGRTALREAYQVGVNPGVRTQLERGLNMYRDHFVTLRAQAEQAVLAVTRDYALSAACESGDAAAITAELQASLERYPELARLVVLDAQGVHVAAARKPERLGPDARELSLQQALPTPGGLQLQATAVAPLAPFRAYQQAGELTEVFRRLETGGGQLRALYLVLYMGFLLSVIVLAIAVGSIISRRVTRRVALLAEATRRVGAGDLRVSVPVDVDDEIGELTGAFNAMVRDMRESRGRIEYLQRVGAWQQFARRLAHEIKNPLTPIQLAVQELHRRYANQPGDFARSLDEAHSIVSEEVATLRRLVGEFTAFARLPEASLSEADLQGFVADNARSLEAVAEEYRSDDVPADALRVEVRTRDEALPVRIDAMMLRRALDNLVRNALEAMRPTASERPGQVWVRARREGATAVLEVYDDGPGIPAEDRTRIFDPYFTTKSDGTGLGLAIVKKVVLEHDGEILCLDSPMGGVRFVIRLPVAGPAQNTK